MVTKAKATELLCDRGWNCAIRDVAKCKVHVIVIRISNVNVKAIAHRDHELSVNQLLFAYFFDQFTSVVRSRTVCSRMTCY